MLRLVDTIPGISPELRIKISEAEKVLRQLDQVEVPMEHVFHAGLYARTARLKAGTRITGSMIKLDTVLIVNGMVSMLMEDGWATLDGFHVLSGLSGRKQVFVCHTDVQMTMIFPSRAETVAQAESEFTDEADLLLSRRQA